MKILLQTDPDRELLDNRIQGEPVTVPALNTETHLVHDIFYADSLKLYTDIANPLGSLLELNKDYVLFRQDTIGTDLSGFPCYRSLIFLAAHPTIYADYHVYGDLLSPELYNETREEVNIALDALEAHKATRGTNAHGATSAATAGELMCRDGNAQAEVGAPTLPNHIARLVDLEAEAAARADADAALASALAVETQDRTDAVDAHAEAQGADVHGSTPEADPDSIMCRDENAQAEVGAPTLPNHIARLVDLEAEAAARADADDLKAPIDSPEFTGVPLAPTPTQGDNSQKIATTEFVTAAVAAGGGSGGDLAAHAALSAAGTHGSTVAATANSLMHRDAEGRSKVAAPDAADDIAQKATVDAHAGLSAAGTHGSSVAATANSLIHRDANGRAKINYPESILDITNVAHLRDSIADFLPFLLNTYYYTLISAQDIIAPLSTDIIVSKPTGCVFALAVVCGSGGGSGGAFNPGNNTCASGGGGGPAQLVLLLRADAFVELLIRLGAGGVAGSSAPGNGGNGGPTYLDIRSQAGVASPIIYEIAGGKGTLAQTSVGAGAAGAGGHFISEQMVNGIYTRFKKNGSPGNSNTGGGTMAIEPESSWIQASSCDINGDSLLLVKSLGGNGGTSPGGPLNITDNIVTNASAGGAGGRYQPAFTSPRSGFAGSNAWAHLRFYKRRTN